MFGSAVLDVAIGVIFVFLLVSVMASAVREMIEAWLKTRATYLEKGIRELLYDAEGSNLAREFFQHPLIYTLYSGGYTARAIKTAWATNGENLPSYIPSRNFALALLDMAARGPASTRNESEAVSLPITFDTIRANVGKLPSPQVQRILLTAVESAQGDLEKTQAFLEAWYDSAMDRVSGWYKRSTQWILLAIGLALAVLLNVNTMTIVAYLYQNEPARQALVEQARAVGNSSTQPAQDFSQIKTEIYNLPLPLGWSHATVPANSLAWVEAIAGWLLTALAVSLGAPFWFDLLNKIMVIRSTVKPHQKSPEESSEDRQNGGNGAGSAAGTPSRAAPASAALALTNPDDLIDGCDVQTVAATRDEDLPAAQGGVS